MTCFSVHWNKLQVHDLLYARETYCINFRTVEKVLCLSHICVIVEKLIIVLNWRRCNKCQCRVSKLHINPKHDGQHQNHCECVKLLSNSIHIWTLPRNCLRSTLSAPGVLWCQTAQSPMFAAPGVLWCRTAQSRMFAACAVVLNLLSLNAVSIKLNISSKLLSRLS